MKAKYILILLILTQLSSCNYILTEIASQILKSTKDETEETSQEEEINYILIDNFNSENYQKNFKKENGSHIYIEDTCLVIDNLKILNKDDFESFHYPQKEMYDSLPVHFSIYSLIRNITSNSKLGYAGIVLTNDQYLYKISISNLGHIDLIETDIVADTSSRLIELEYKNFSDVSDLRIKISAGNLAIYANNLNIYEAKFKGYKWGDFGLYSDKGSKAKFQYFAVTNDTYSSE